MLRSLLPFVYLIIIPLGIYLLFYKRNRPALPPEELIKTFKLSEQGQKVKLKELRKETAPMFTRKWIFEYWNGERTVFHAWVTWIVVGGVCFKIFATPFYIKLYDFKHHNIPLNFSAYDYTLAIFSICYSAFIFIVIWRCSRNSSLFYKYFSRSLLFGLFVLSFIKY